MMSTELRYSPNPYKINTDRKCVIRDEVYTSFPSRNTLCVQMSALINRLDGPDSGTGFVEDFWIYLNLAFQDRYGEGEGEGEGEEVFLHHSKIFPVRAYVKKSGGWLGDYKEGTIQIVGADSEDGRRIEDPANIEVLFVSDRDILEAERISLARMVVDVVSEVVRGFNPDYVYKFESL